MNKLTSSLIMILKFSAVLILSTLFFVGLVIGEENIITASGIGIITYAIYRKISQLNAQFRAYKKIPEQLRNIMTNANLENIFGELKTEKGNGDKRGYQ